MSDDAQFLWVTCQAGAERAAKAELARCRPELRVAFSRPGFLTFKAPAAEGLALPTGVFVRSAAWSIGQAQGEELTERVEQAWRTAAGIDANRLHVWPRDARVAGDQGYEPGLTEASATARSALLAASPADRDRAALAQRARPGDRVLDVILVEDCQWWIGWHVATPGPACLPGGLDQLELPYEAVSRAWLKTVEALCWSQLPIRPGEACVEIGCAPGGSCQALLSKGLLVTGIDPADMHPAVLAHPNFLHIRKRGADVRRREFRPFRWLTADMNVAPNYTLDTVEAIVTHPAVNIRGMLLTLKLADWELANEVPQFVERVRSWGYADVRARHLQHNRREICLAALRSPSAKSTGRGA